MLKPLEILINKCGNETLARNLENALIDAGYVIVERKEAYDNAVEADDLYSMAMISSIPNSSLLYPQIKARGMDSEHEGVFNITYFIQMQDFSTTERTIEARGITVANAVENGKIYLLESMSNIKHISASRIKETGL